VILFFWGITDSGSIKLFSFVLQILQDSREFEDEDQHVGQVDWSVYWTYVTAGLGFKVAIFTAMLCIVLQLAVISSDFWLAHW